MTIETATTATTSTTSATATSTTDADMLMRLRAAWDEYVRYSYWCGGAMRDWDRTRVACGWASSEAKERSWARAQAAQEEEFASRDEAKLLFDGLRRLAGLRGYDVEADLGRELRVSLADDID